MRIVLLPPDEKSVTSSLAGTFPVIERYHMNAYRDTGWCKYLLYERGKFVDAKDNPEGCTSQTITTQQFDEQSKQDFAALAQAFSGGRVKVVIVDVQFDDAGKVRRAEFHKDCTFCRTRYVFSPGYGNLPEGDGNKWFRRIDENWYLADEDWN
jgi:hypothetical protein